jgi:hypothetical protein
MGYSSCLTKNYTNLEAESNRKTEGMISRKIKPEPERMIHMKKNMPQVLLWGGLWGISEATIGYITHLLLPGMGWVFYYPIAYGFMKMAYNQTGKSRVVLYCAILSAAIKLINLPMTPRLDYVINPAVSILLEGLAAGFAFHWIHGKNKPMIRLGLMPFMTSAIWRGLYLVYLLLAPGLIRAASILFEPGKLLSFVTLELIGNGLVIALWSMGKSLLLQKTKLPLVSRLAGGQGLFKRFLSIMPITSVCLAVLLQWIF